MKNVKKLIIHCSDSRYGNNHVINQWHRERGWAGIGYHYVITNGLLTPRDSYRDENDGLIQKGRSESSMGAHCHGQNRNSIGICLIGKAEFTSKQMSSLKKLMEQLTGRHNILHDDVYGHCEFNTYKSCPNINPEKIRNLLKQGVCNA